MATKNNLTPYMVAAQDNSPTWKKLGYSSEAAYLNATLKPQTPNTPTLNNYAPVANMQSTPILGSIGSTKLPSSLNKNLFVNPGSGLVGGAGQGVTREGVVLGGGNVERFPTIRPGTSVSPGKSTLPGGVLSPGGTLTPGSVLSPGNSLAGGLTPRPSLSDYVQYANSSNAASGGSSAPAATAEREERTDEGSYNGTSDFLEAFKQNYGYDYDGAPLERREGMSDGTWNALQSLYKYYQQGQSDEAKRQEEIDSENSYYDEKKSEVEQAYDASRQQLGENKNRAQQNASISLDKLLRYLPSQARAQGYEDLGTSESSALKAYANYNNNMGDIASDYNSQMADLDQGEISEKGKLDDSRRESLAGINDKYESFARERVEAAGQEAQAAWDAYEVERKAKEEQLRQEASAKETQTYEDYSAMLNYSTSTDYDSLVSGIDALDISEEYKQLLRHKARIIVDANIKTQADEEEAKKKSESEELYASVDEAVRLKIESSIGDDGKISQSDYDEIAKYIESYKGRLSDSQIASLNALLEGNQTYVRTQEQEQETQKQDAYHTVVTGDVDFNNNGGWWIFGSTDFSAGDNFSVKDSSGRKYRIESGGEVADEEIAQAAFEVGNNQVFGYGGKIYIKRGGKIYLIQKRANSYEGDYNDLYAKYYK